MKNTNESETLEGIRDHMISELESSLDTLAQNTNDSIELAKSAYNKLSGLELWDYFSEVESESAMERLQEIIDAVKHDLESIVGKLTE